MPRLIDADALIYAITLERMKDRSAVYQAHECDVIAATFGTARDLVHAAPTIDPVKHGRWISKSDDDGCSWWECSECEGALDSLADKSPHCPSCGAKMDKEEPV